MQEEEDGGGCRRRRMEVDAGGGGWRWMQEEEDGAHHAEKKWGVLGWRGGVVVIYNGISVRFLKTCAQNVSRISCAVIFRTAF
jgi:hypothetical protein